jgi:hypothetical protein
MLAESFPASERCGVGKSASIFCDSASTSCFNILKITWYTGNDGQQSNNQYA